MKYLLLLSAGIRRKPIHTVLTTLAIAVAFLLFGVLHGVIAGFDSALDKMSDTRLRVINRANFLEPLPLAHAARIARVPGITRVAPAAIFPSYYQQPRQNVSAAAVDVDAFLEVFPEIRVPREQREALLRTRTGATVGGELAKRYGWKIGDRIPLTSYFWLTEDGDRVWELDIVGIHNAGPEDEEIFGTEVYFNYSYLDEARATDKGTAHQFIVSIDDPAHGPEIAQAIDLEFANSSYETTTLSDRQWVTSRISQVGNVRLFVYSILLAVLFTLLFLTGTAMAQTIRERIPELGVLKAVGFSDVAVFAMVLSESLVRCLVGALIGLGIAILVFPSVFRALGSPAPPVPLGVVALGLGIAALLSLAVALWPALRAQRLTIAEAIGGH